MYQIKYISNLLVAFVRRIDTFLKNHNEYSEDYSQLFSNIAASVGELF